MGAQNLVYAARNRGGKRLVDFIMSQLTRSLTPDSKIVRVTFGKYTAILNSSEHVQNVFVEI